jgi:hypothetical protein
MTRAWSRIRDCGLELGLLAACYGAGELIGYAVDLIARRLS